MCGGANARPNKYTVKNSDGSGYIQSRIQDAPNIRFWDGRLPHRNHFRPGTVAYFLPVRGVQPLCGSAKQITSIFNCRSKQRWGTYVCIRVREIYAPEGVAARSP
jgi:hypothetical protein